MNTPLPAPSPRQTSTLAIVSLVSGILGLTVVPFLGGIVAIVTGHMARKEISLQPDRYEGDGLAVGGLIMGYLVVVGTMLLVLGAILFFGGLAALLAYVQ